MIRGLRQVRRGVPDVSRRLTLLLTPLLALTVLSGRGEASTPALKVESSVPVSEQEVVRGNPERPNVALVINVGAGFEPATGMLQTLAEKEYRATFFVMGWWAERQPDILRRIAQDGHEVASHGHRVFDLTQVSSQEVRDDLEAADAAISAVTGRTTRPLWSASASARNREVNQIAASLGYRPIFWTLDSADWRSNATAEGIYRRVMDHTVNGSIVVLHFDSPTTVNSTAVALPWLIDDLRAAGFQLVTITELLTAD
jgi:peptidoglycan/xylan/chitin deacetylase (PgdA/CDA1 family)